MKRFLLKQEALPDIASSINISLKFENIKKTAESLLSKSITPTQPIQELLNDSVLQLWVKQGIPLHKEKRDVCAFCRQSLPKNIWQALDSHFSKESSDLESSIDDCLTSIATAIDAIPGFVVLTGDMFYSEEKAEFISTIDYDTERIRIAGLKSEANALLKSIGESERKT